MSMPVTPATTAPGSPCTTLTAGARPVDAPDGALVTVQCEWNGWRSALVRAADLEDIHWAQPAGAPRALLHARVRCDKVVSGVLPHDCAPGMAAHDLVVCILKCRTAVGVYDALTRCAGTPADAR
jgi:hypothetical protein